MIKCDVRGMLKFEGDIARVPQELKTAAWDAIDKSAAEMEKKAKFAAPVGTEQSTHIRDSVRIESGDAATHERIVTIGDSAHVYAIPLEYGHADGHGGHVPANPFWVPTSRVVNKTHKARIRRAIRKALRLMFP